MAKPPKIIYFINSVIPTEEQKAEAASYQGVLVVFRNVRYIQSVDEDCDGVAGLVPDCYAKHPAAKKVCAAAAKEAKNTAAKAAEISAGTPPKIEDSGENTSCASAGTGEPVNAAAGGAWVANV